ncbi:MAG: PhoH family protein [Victivallales bacterium]|nr:PhoH family protein [Victivallales bacterium]
MLILDTNVLLFDPQAIYHFPNTEILIPLAVVEEIDRFKHDNTETGRNARQLAVEIDSLRATGSLKNGVALQNGATLKIIGDDSPEMRHDRDASDAILRLAARLMQEHPDNIAPTIITKNVNLRLKADALGLVAKDYTQGPVRDTDTLKGWHIKDFDASAIIALKNGNALPAAKLKFQPNEYVFAREKDNPKNAACARFYAKTNELWPLDTTSTVCCGIRPLNLEQVFSFDALLDDSIKLVTLAGKAGTGKTLLAIAAGLQQVFGENRYQKLLVFRPTMPVSRDMGYLPGDLSEKMKPWMQPVYDALEFIRAQDRRMPSRTLPNDVLTCPEISIEPLTYIRGRSIPNQFIIIDEAQNLTPLEVKTAITRVGNGSKVILTGDPAQIDNPYVDRLSNGLTQLVDKFQSSPLSAHLTLMKGERSELAETASMLL